MKYISDTDIVCFLSLISMTDYVVGRVSEGNDYIFAQLASHS